MNTKIFDCVFYYGNIELLNRRIFFNKGFVSHTFVVVSEINAHKIYSENLNQDCVTILVENENYNNLKYYSKLLRDELKKHFNSFEDLVFISDENEIPFIQQFIKTYDGEIDTPYLYHKICSSDRLKCQKMLSEGTVVLNMGEITTNRNFLSLKKNLNKNFFNLDDKIEGGITFMSADDELKEKYFCENSKKYVPYDFNINGLNKNFLITYLEPKDSEIKEYDEIFVVEITNNFPEILYFESEEKIKRVRIFVPQTQIYEDHNFRKNYIRRESLRILNFSNKTNDDIVWISGENGLESFRIKELKNPS